MSPAQAPTSGQPTPELTVLQSFPTPTANSNPYTVLLRDALAATGAVRVVTFSWRTALRGRYDVFHAHWPETLVESRGRAKTAARRALAWAFLARLRSRGTPVVRTVHNLATHETSSRGERRFLRALDRLTTLRIVLTEHSVVAGPVQLVPHGHYRDWFAPHPRVASVPGRLAFVGLVRRYKNVDGLIAAFAEVPEPSLSLRIAGAPSPGMAEELAAAASDRRVSLALRRLSEQEFVAEVGASELVVLPYRHMHNSGAVLAALSLDRPVLVPDNATNRDLAAEVGPGWVWTFDGDLDAAALTRAVEGVRTTARSGRPDLAARGWPASAAAHLAAYRRAAVPAGSSRR